MTVGYAAAIEPFALGFRARDLSELGRQATLPDARLTQDEEDAAATGCQPPYHLTGLRQLALPADQGRSHLA